MTTNEERLICLEKYFGNYERKGHDYYFYCPNKCHAFKKKLSVDLDKNKYHCWICGYGGGDVYFLMKKFFPNSYEDWGHFFPSLPKSGKILTNEEKSFDASVVLDFDGSLPLVSDYWNKLPQIVMEYLLRKRITRALSSAWNIRFSPTQEPFLVVPSIGSDGNVDYYTKRFLSVKEGGMKFVKPKVPFRIFNKFWIEHSHEVFLVENVFDAMRFEIYKVEPVLGSSVHGMVDFIEMCRERKKFVKIFFDIDAIDKAFRTYYYLRENGIECAVVKNVVGKNIDFLNESEFQYVIRNFYNDIEISYYLQK